MAALLSACAATAPTTIATRHVPTWAYDDATVQSVCNGGQGASPALVDRWLTYAESNCGPESLTHKALTDCSQGGVTYCTPVAYVEPNWSYRANARPILGACNPSVSPDEPESWWLHVPGTTTPSPENRVTTAAGGGGTLLDQTTQAVRAWFQAYARQCLGGYPALMIDDTGASLAALLFSSTGGQSATSEISGNAGLVAAHEQLAAALTRADGSGYLQIDNGLPANNSLAPPFPLLGHPAGVRGLIAEGAPLGGGLITPDAADPPAPDPAYYATLLDELAYVDTRGGDDFIVLLSDDPSGSTSARLSQQATEMLGYSGDHVVDWANLETGDAAAGDLSVWPEEGIVPTDPVRSMTAPAGSGCLAGDGAVCTGGGHVDLQVHGAPGVYVREFHDCYDQGSLFGPCAAIVNDTAAGHTVAPGWLTQTYRSEISLRGGDVQSGGTVAVDGVPFAAGSTVIGPWSAMLLAGARGSG